MVNRLVVVSGGTKGIGRALIEKFSEAGFHIGTYSRNKEELEALRVQIEGKFGNKVLVLPTDASSESEVKEFGKMIQRSGIPIEVLINNTGTFEPGTILDEDEGVLQRTLSTNVESAYHLSRMLIPDMKKNRRGHVFNVCSTASITAYTNGGSYCISKFALLGMSRVLREELKDHNIRVTSILPGATYTASWEGVELPESRFMKSTDVADMVFASYQLSQNATVEEIVLRPQLGDL